MNKKLIVTAMGLVLAGGMGLANADVKLYGQLDVSIDSTDYDGGEDDVNMGSNRSAVGFKGSEDLGNGLSAFFKVEYQTDIDDEGFAPGTNEDDTNNTSGSANGWKSRDQYIGLKSEGFGKLTFGAMSTAYKSPASKLDPFYRTRNQSRNIGLQSTLHKGKGEEGHGRATNTARYDSPTFLGGATVFGTYTFDNNKGTGLAPQEDDDPYSLGVSYKGGGLYAFASYVTTQGGGDDDATQLAVKYTLGDAAFWGMYEIDGGLITLNQNKANAGGTKTNVGAGDGADIWNIGASYTIGNNLVSVDYAEGDDTDLNGGGKIDSSYTSWRLGGYHKFSNRTRVYATFSQQDFDAAVAGHNKGEQDIFSVGLRHNF